MSRKSADAKAIGKTICKTTAAAIGALIVVTGNWRSARDRSPTAKDRDTAVQACTQLTSEMAKSAASLGCNLSHLLPAATAVSRP